MGRGLRILVLAAGVSALMQQCRQPVAITQNADYFGHLPLDSTVLLVRTLADSLEVPWDLEIGPGDWVWFTQQSGSIHRVHGKTGALETLGEIRDVYYRKSTGLLSMLLHPDFETTPLVFLHYTYAEKDSAFTDRIFSRLVSLPWKNGKLGEPVTLLDAIPGNTYHNGSRMVFGEDGMIYLGTGDAGRPDSTQHPQSLAGKVLRLSPDGSVPGDNPVPGSYVWSSGHRNIQGISTGNRQLYASEHGPNNDDEVNLIEMGGNYGWPDVHGFCDLPSEQAYCEAHGIKEPMFAWTPTAAVSGMAYYGDREIPEWQNSLLLATLKGQSLRVLNLSREGRTIIRERIYLQKDLGRIRDIAVGPDGEVYLASSNLDWHPGHQPWMYDSLPTGRGDRIMKIEALPGIGTRDWKTDADARILKESKAPFELPTEDFAFAATDEDLKEGQRLYQMHCASCHRPDGQGNIGEIPPLVNSAWVTGNTGRLIDLTLMGLNTPIEVNGIRYEGEMPAYRHLEDGEIRDILNFIRIRFGAASGNIIAADIKHQRKGLE